MEDFEIVLNDTSSMNDSLLGEFPYWRESLSVSLLGSFSLSSYLITVHLLLLIVLLKLKKEQFRPLNLIHASLLVSTILEDVLRFVLDVLYLPSYYRNCFCPLVLSVIYSLLISVFAVYRQFTFACLGLLQFLVILGKKKLTNTKVACGMIAVCVGLSLIFMSAVVNTFIDTNERAFCYESFCPDSRPESGSGFGVFATIFLILIMCSFLPSLIVVSVTSTWSCAVFKHYYTGGDDQLNRRILSLPIVMPLALVASTVFEGILALLTTEILLTLDLGVYFPYWISVAQSLLSLTLRFFTRSTYPLVLIYTHSYIREALKGLLKRARPANQVTPSQSAEQRSSF